MIWRPHVTVAAVCRQDDRFLVVEESVDGQIYINQPAGHLEANESLIEAVIRETLEETARSFKPEFLVGVYQWQHPEKDISYLRFAFYGSVGEPHEDRTLDEGILRARWITLEELGATHLQHRNPLVLRCVDDFLQGKKMPLDMLIPYL